GTAGAARLAGAPARLRSSSAGVSDAADLDRAARHVLAHGPRRERQLGPRAGEPAPAVDVAPALPRAAPGAVSARALRACPPRSAHAVRPAIGFGGTPSRA